MSKPEILYVDDEPINLDLFSFNFMADYKVHKAESGFEGLDLMDSLRLPVIISDLKMPKMNGLEFIAEVKRRYPTTVCIMLTAFMESEVMLEAINNDLIYRYILKPYIKEDVKRIIDSAFEKYHSSLMA